MFWDKYRKFKKNPVAYFCAEYALWNHTPFYTGGLGILAGDYIQEVIEENFPMVAFGLFYHKEHQHGMHMEEEHKTPEQLGLTLVKNSTGNTLKIAVPINNRKIFVQVWAWKKSSLTLYLLDTQVPENTAPDWAICDYLYVEDRFIRLMQELVLGIGGVKILQTFNIKPSLYHLNEGHCAFITLELLKKENAEDLRKKIVFTNHTLVSAGQEKFDIAILKSVLVNYGPLEEFLKLGFDRETRMFGMTNLALSMSCRVNAVSKLHGKIAVREWGDYHIETITNGIYEGRWDMLKHYSHKEQKRKLLDLIREQSGVTFKEDVLLVGWARRFVDYKRPLVIFEDVERIRKIAQRQGHKVCFVFSSVLNATYIEENALMRRLQYLINTKLKDIVAYIPNYNVEIAKAMTSGCDVWLNTPMVGYEACGTSGMKAALNGVLPLSTRDGWIDEVDLTDIGWIVEDGKDITKNLLDALEEYIVPEFYDNPDGWKKRTELSRKLIRKDFSTKRMLRDYIKKMYTL